MAGGAGGAAFASAAGLAKAKARLALQSGQPGWIDKLILFLPAQRADAGLALDRFRWRVWARMPDLARDLMLERSTSAGRCAIRRPGPASAPITPACAASGRLGAG